MLVIHVSSTGLDTVFLPGADTSLKRRVFDIRTTEGGGLILSSSELGFLAF